jgi:hypothetical protein
MFCVE